MTQTLDGCPETAGYIALGDSGAGTSSCLAIRGEIYWPCPL